MTTDPLVGPRRTLGRLIAGETVTAAERAQDDSKWILVYVSADDVPRPPADAIGFIAQCATCPQRAVLHIQVPGDWHCPRCNEPADPFVGALQEIQKINARAGFGDVDVDQGEPDDWPIGKVTW